MKEKEKNDLDKKTIHSVVYEFEKWINEKYKTENIKNIKKGINSYRVVLRNEKIQIEFLTHLEKSQINIEEKVKYFHWGNKKVPIVYKHVEYSEI